ncbi:MAG: hypothetical protein KKF50_04360 [Nanoarchaeota archaeon]|nr:hypothetical protein [Nanoarchaeota archaeon]
MKIFISFLYKDKQSGKYTNRCSKYDECGAGETREGATLALSQYLDGLVEFADIESFSLNALPKSSPTLKKIERKFRENPLAYERSFSVTKGGHWLFTYDMTEQKDSPTPLRYDTRRKMAPESLEFA